MPAKPNVCVVLQCRQITFKGEGTKFLKKDLYYYHYYFCNYCYYYSIIIIAVAADTDNEISKNFCGCAKKVFKSGTFVFTFQRLSGYCLLYRRIEKYKSHESVYNSFLDA